MTISMPSHQPPPSTGPFDPPGVPDARMTRFGAYLAAKPGPGL